VPSGGFAVLAKAADSIDVFRPDTAASAHNRRPVQADLEDFIARFDGKDLSQYPLFGYDAYLSEVGEKVDRGSFFKEWLRFRPR